MNISDDINYLINQRAREGKDLSEDKLFLLIGDEYIKELEECFKHIMFTGEPVKINPKLDGGKFVFNGYRIYFWYGYMIKLVEY